MMQFLVQGILVAFLSERLEKPVREVGKMDSGSLARMMPFANRKPIHVHIINERHDVR